MPHPRIRRAVEGDLDDAARTLGAAFEVYPWTRWSVPGEGYARRLERLQRLYLGHALEAGIVLVSDDVRGVLALLPSVAPPPDDDVLALVADLHGERMAAVSQVEIPAQPEGAWNLATLGVHPGSQGMGLGGALIRAGIDAVDAADSGRSAGIALETSDERNVRLYARAGFEVTATTTIEDGPVVYSMALTGQR